MIRLLASSLLVAAALLAQPLGASQAAAPPAAPAPAPAPPISVIDDANVFGAPFEADMNQRLADLRARSDIHFILVSIGDLKGADINTYGQQMLEKWGSEHPEDRFSVLLVLAPKDREFAVTKLISAGPPPPGETAEEAERIMRDAQAILGRLEAVVSSVVVPPFQQGDFEGGMRAAVDVIVEEILNSPFAHPPAAAATKDGFT